MGCCERWGEVGGIAALAKLVVDYSRLLEADLLRWFHTDLLLLGRGLTYRRLGVLFAALPADSLTMSELVKAAPKKPQSGSTDMSGWTLDQQLLAMVANLVAGGNWQRGGGKGAKPDLFGGSKNERVGGGESPLTPEEKAAALAARAPKRKA